MGSVPSKLPFSFWWELRELSSPKINIDKPVRSAQAFYYLAAVKLIAYPQALIL